jgi:hypothetical protein
MALVEIARFLDLSEAQAAAAALRASDIPAVVQAEAYQPMSFGGFRLWAPSEEAEDARAFLAESRGAS